MPMPRLTYWPSSSSRAARAASSSRVRAIGSALLVRRRGAADGRAARSACRRPAPASARRRGATKTPGQVHLVGVELAGLDELLDLGDGDPRRPCAASGLKLRADSWKTRLPCRSPTAARTSAKSAVSAVSSTYSRPPKTTHLLRRARDRDHVAVGVVAHRDAALGDQRADAGGRVEGGDAGAAGAQPLGQRALRGELDLQLAGQVLPGELLVLADERADRCG